MKAKPFFLTVLLWVWCSCAHVVLAQVSLEEYFHNILKNGCSEIPLADNSRIEINELESRRMHVWRVWQTVNDKFAEDKLPPLRPLAQADAVYWPIPAHLEPDAVMPFYYGTKGDKPTQGWPLFLYLHGSGPKEQEFATGFVLCNRFDDAPSLYFIPQIPREGTYYRWWQRSKQFVWERLLRQTLSSGMVDANRIYIFGISEGGYGSQRLASFYADYLAAAGPMAGGEVTENAPAENCGHIGFSFLTGDRDIMFGRNRLTARAGELLDSLQELYPGEYVHSVELIPERGHHIDYSPTTPWLRSFVRNPRPLHFLWEDFPMDGNYRKGFYNIQVHERDTTDGNERTRYEMTIRDNVVTLTLRRVRYHTTERESQWGIPIRQTALLSKVAKGRFTLYLAPDMVDFSRPVKVLVNGHKVFSGKLMANESNLVRSCACFFDPERLFPAAVEVNLNALFQEENKTE